jgi:hypothetical protein
MRLLPENRNQGKQEGDAMSQYGTEASTVEFGTTGDGGTTDQVRGQVREKAQVAQDKARGRISEQVDQRSTQAGERIAGTASDVRSIAEELRNQGKDTPATLAEQVAGQADRVGDYLKGASGDRILRDAEEFARRQPWLVAAGGLALGFAASRFLKASSSRRYQTSRGGYDGGGYGRTSTSAYGTRTSYDTGTAYPTGTTSGVGDETEVPVVGAYDPDPAPAEPLGDAYDQRRV